MYPLSPSKNYYMSMTTSQFHSNFIFRSRLLLFHVSNYLLTMNIQLSIFIEWVGHGKGCNRVNENHLTFTSKGDVQAMNRK